MKVRVAVTLHVDPGAWARVYGVEPEEVQDDVESWAYNTLHGQLDALGLGA